MTLIKKIIIGGILISLPAFAGCAYSKINSKKKESLEIIIEKESKEIPKTRLKFWFGSMIDSYPYPNNTISANKFIMKNTDSLLKEIDCDNILGRIFKAVTTDTISTYFFLDCQHEELGHVYRAEKQGIGAESHLFLRHPWLTERKPYSSINNSYVSENPLNMILFRMGGIESELMLANDLMESSMAEKWQSYYDAFAYFTGKTDRLFNYLCKRPNSFDGLSAKELKKWRCDDILLFTKKVNECLDLDMNPKDIKRESVWELLDGMYVLSSINVFRHIYNGTRQMPMPKMMASVNYNLTPFGSEHYLNFLYRNDSGILTRIYARKGTGENAGIGFKLANIPITENIKISAGVDLWNQIFPGGFKKYNGAGLDANVEFQVSLGKDLFLNFMISYKKKGYNLGKSLEEELRADMGFGTSF